MRGDDVRRERDYPKFTPDELNAVYASRDWQERMVRVGDTGGPDVHSRLCALARTRRAVLARDRVPAFGSDVAFVHDVHESRWLDDFNAFASDPVRAASARPFDARLLFALPAPGCQGHNYVTRAHVHVEDRRLERVARSTKGAWIPAHDAIHVTRLLASQREQWPSAPSAWTDMEVPYRLRSGTPLVVRTHGLLMVHYGYGAPCFVGDAASARARAAWCAALSLSVQLVAGELVDECARFGRLFWVPPALVAVMREMGGERLLGAVTGRERLLEHLLDGVESVRWDHIDPCGTVCAKSTTFGTPVFISGDAASWDATVHPHGVLAVDPRLIRPRHERPRRGEQLWGFMTPAGRREPCHGWGLRTASWRGIAVDEMRVGGPCGWEREAAARWSEHLNRLQGASATGVQRELLRLGNKDVNQRDDSRSYQQAVPTSTGVNVSHSGRVRQDNTPAWVVKQRNAKEGKKRVYTDMPPRVAPPRPSETKRQGACGDPTGVRNKRAAADDRYFLFSWERRQDLAIQVMSSLLELASDTGRLGEVVADDVRNLITGSVHSVVRDLLPPRGQVMQRPTDEQARKLKELMQRVLCKAPTRHNECSQRDLMTSYETLSDQAPASIRVTPPAKLGLRPGSSASHARIITSLEKTSDQLAQGAASSPGLACHPTDSSVAPSSKQDSMKRRADMLDLCQYPRNTSPKRQRRDPSNNIVERK